MQGVGRLSAHTDAVVDHVPCQCRAVDEDQPPGGVSCRALRVGSVCLDAPSPARWPCGEDALTRRTPANTWYGVPPPARLATRDLPQRGRCWVRYAAGNHLPHWGRSMAERPSGGGQTSPTGGGRWPKGHRVGAKPPPLGEVDGRKAIGWGPHRTRPIRRVHPGDTASCPHTSKTCITSSPKWLMTFTAMRPWSGGSKGREVSRWRLLQASSSISAFRAVFRAL